MKTTLLLIISLFMTASITAGQIDIMKGFNIGKYNVGFRYEKILDSSRTYDDSFRPIQLFIWYPANENANEAIDFSDYITLNDLKTEPWETNKDIEYNLIKDEIQEQFGDQKNKVELTNLISQYKKLKTIAHKDADIIDQKFPLIVFAPGGNTPGYLNSTICEYLASHGYIVASFPTISKSDSLRWPFDQTGLELYVDDMELSIKHLSNTIKEINTEKIGLAAWSVGGVSQVLLAGRNNEIDVLVSLDTGLGREYGVEMLKESPNFDFMNIDIPYLHFTGQQKEIYNVARSDEFINSIKSLNKYSEFIEAFAHQHFASSIGFIPELVEKGNEDSNIVKAYGELCNRTLSFLNKFLLQ